MPDGLYVNYLPGKVSKNPSPAPFRQCAGRGGIWMPSYKAPVEDVMFLLKDVFQIERYNNLPGFEDATPETIEAILAEGAKLCEEAFAPLNRIGDQEGCERRDDGSVKTPTGFRDAYRAYVEGGWMGLSAPVDYGGQGLPTTLNT